MPFNGRAEERRVAILLIIHAHALPQQLAYTTHVPGLRSIEQLPKL
jgi:hypothetical protein